MATTVIKVNCGCNRQFTSIAEAEAHANATSHTLQISGTIRSSGGVSVNNDTKAQGFATLGDTVRP